MSPSYRWLLKTKQAAGADGGPTQVYEWGEAARDEISESEIKAFIDAVGRGYNNFV